MDRYDFHVGKDVTKPLITEAELEQFINSKPELNTEEKKKLVKDFYKTHKIWQENSDIYKKLNEEVANGIAKKYGFWDNDAATPEQRKYVGLNGLIKDLDLTRSIAGKNIDQIDYEELPLFQLFL